jgi:hypothetical protein
MTTVERMPQNKRKESSRKNRPKRINVYQRENAIWYPTILELEAWRVKKAAAQANPLHHLVPNSMMQVEKTKTAKTDEDRNSKDSNGQANCPDYKYAQAPCVCAEGVSQHDCTHKEVHDESAVQFVETFKEPNQPPEKQINLDQAISDGAKAYEKAFKHSDCTKSKNNPKKSGCIEAQLREHYNRKCHGNLDFFVIPVDGKSRRKMS